MANREGVAMAPRSRSTLRILREGEASRRVLAEAECTEHSGHSLRRLALAAEDVVHSEGDRSVSTLRAVPSVRAVAVEAAAAEQPQRTAARLDIAVLTELRGAIGSRNTGNPLRRGSR